MKLSAKDKKVIERFTDPIKQPHGWFGRDLEGDKLSSDGETLNGHWVGGNRIAYWEHDKVHFSDLGSKAAQTVQNAVRKALPQVARG